MPLPTISKSIRMSSLSLAVSQAVALGSTQAANIIVTADDDVPLSNNCTLREAIESINMQSLQNDCTIANGAFGSNDTITFALPDESIIGLSAGSLEITESMIIDGSMVDDLTISGVTGDTRVFGIFGDSVPSPFPPYRIEVTIQDLAIVGGNVDDSSLTFQEQSGGGILAYGFSDVDIDRVDILGNRAGYGGGLAAVVYASVTISNSAIESNTATAAGGVMANAFGSVLIQESSVNNNHARALGGGIGITEESEVEIMDSTVSFNLAQAIPEELADGVLHTIEQSEGGGISADGNSQLTIRDSLISENQGALGGGIHLYETYAVIEQSEISNNQSTFIDEVDKTGGGNDYPISYQSGNGGGIFARGNSLAFVRQTSIDNNTNPFSGGGILINQNSSLAIYESSITNNDAILGGGGISVLSDSNVSIINSTISGNSVISGAGGGVFGLYANRLGLFNSTLSNNSAGGSAGGLFSGGGDSELRMINTIITDNHADTYADFADPDGTLQIGGAFGSNANIFGDSSKTFAESMLISGLTLFPTGSDIIATTTTRGGAPNDAPYSVGQIIKPISLLSNGTYAYKLPDSSPAIDAGDSFFCEVLSLGDQTGATRDNFCDIGAIELDQSFCVVVPAQNGNVVTFCL